MLSYSTTPADLESEATLLNTPKSKTKTSLLVGGVAAAAFVLGVLAATSSISTTPSVSTALSATRESQIQVTATMERAREWMCLDIPGQYLPENGGALENGIGLQIWECGDWNNGWRFTIWEDGRPWGLEWKDSGFCVDAHSGGAGGAEGVQLVLWECNGNADQEWKYDHNGYQGEVNDMDTIYLASSDPSGPTLCMDVAGGAINDNGTPVQAWECNGDDGADLPNQQWTVDHN